MAGSSDLIDFDVIEGQKENIQSLPGGRSAKKLAQIYSPSTSTPLQKLATPTPSDTKNVNDCIRAEYEAEVQNISESDDPLDVFDRYVRWTLDAYPSAQATPQSQLHTLLERATKHFIGSAQYKDDPRYLKLWLLYIQFFTDSPRETFIYAMESGSLSRCFTKSMPRGSRELRDGLKLRRSTRLALSVKLVQFSDCSGNSKNSKRGKHSKPVKTTNHLPLRCQPCAPLWRLKQIPSALFQSQQILRLAERIVAVTALQNPQSRKWPSFPTMIRNHLH